MLSLPWRLATLAGCLALALPLALATPLALETHAVSGVTGYVTEHVVVDVQGTLWLTNTDLRAHDIVAVASGPQDNPWCDRYVSRACPLFASPLLGLGEQGIVEGTEQLAPTQSYAFYCSIHSWMTGTLTAL